MKIAAALLAALALGLTACGGGGETTTSATTAPAPADTAADGTETASTGGGGAEYPSAARESFLDSCEAGGSAEQCECALEYLEQNVPLEEFVQAGIEVSEGGEPPAFIEEAEKNCA